MFWIVYLMHLKSEIFEEFKESQTLVEKQSEKQIKTLQLDFSGEHLLGELDDHLIEEGIVSQLTTSDTLK